MSERQARRAAAAPREHIAPSREEAAPGEDAVPGSAAVPLLAAFPPPAETAPPDTERPDQIAPLEGIPQSTAARSDMRPPFDAWGLLREQLAEADEGWELSAAEIAALPRAGDAPPELDEVPWWLSEEFTGTDAEQEAAFVRSLPADIRAEYAAGPWTGTGEVWGAGFVHHDQGAGPRGDGFCAGGEHDVLAPGPELARLVAATGDDRGQLGESELIGVLCGWQRLTSWAQSGQAACVNELIRRRKEQSVALRRPSLAAHVDDEVAAALALTGAAAGRLLYVSAGLARLPAVAGALAGGRIDWVKAGLFADYLAGLPDDDAAAIAAAVLAGAAGRKTSGQLRAALVRAVLAYDPQSAQRRREAARRDACVRAWDEVSGNGALAGRELAPADVVHASARLTEYARWLREHGAAGSVDQLRAAAFVALLTGQPLDTLLPAAAAAGGSASAGGSAANDASAGGGDSSDGDRAGIAAARLSGADLPDGAGLAAGWPQLTGSINLTMPMSAWLGQSAAPGELAGYGPADAATCAELAGRAGLSARWCLTLTDAAGRAVAHACAGHRPPPRGELAISWARELRCKLEVLESGTCSHLRRSDRYTPPLSLRNLVMIRQRRCSFPGCRRPARRCDLDHTVPFDQGGATCECNLAPLCRRHHQAKQAPGWHLTQDQPGIMTWRMPSGRTYQTTGELYPV